MKGTISPLLKEILADREKDANSLLSIIKFMN